MSKMTRNFHVLHRSGNIGNEFIPKEKNIMTSELKPGSLLPPGVNIGADECPANGRCDSCILASGCTKLHELRTYADEHDLLLPAEFTAAALPRPGAGAQGDDDTDGTNRPGSLLPPGVV